MSRGVRARRHARLLVAAICAALVLGPASSALAHVDLVDVDPATGAVLDTVPTELTMRFSGRVNPEAFEFRLFHRDGRSVPFTGDGPVFDGAAVSIKLPALDLGTYVVVWSSTGLDGHLAAGQTYFSVGFEESGAVTDFIGDSRGGGTAENLLRWMLTATLALTLGLLWLRAVMPQLVPDPVRHLGRLLLLLALVRLTMVAGQVGDTRLGGLQLILGSGPGRFGWGLLLGGALLVWLGRRPQLQLAGLLIAAAGSTLAGHLGNQRGAYTLVPLATAHLLAAALWAGAPAAALLWARQTGVGTFARRFTPWALGSVAVLAVSGIGLSVLRTSIEEPGGISALTGYRYGTVLLAKWAVLLCVIVPLGAYHLLRSSGAAEPPSGATGDPDSRPGAAGEPGPADSPDSSGETTRETRRPAAARSLWLLGAEVAGLAAVIALGTVLGGLSPAGSSQVQLSGGDLLATPTSFEACVGKQDETDQFVCVVRYFENIALTAGMPKALEEMAGRWDDGDSWMQRNCHAINHHLGRLGYRIYKNIHTAFDAGSDPCDYGYLHGVIEGASADFSDEQLRDTMTTLCEGTGDAGTHTYRSCIHGIGHAVGRRVNNDLPRGMDFCREFYQEGMTPSFTTKDPASLVFALCVTGVAMEWNLQPKAVEDGDLPVGHPDTLLGKCLTLDPIFQDGCILYGTITLGGSAERAIEARDWCDANIADPLACYQAIGRDVTWSPSISGQQAMEICMGGKPGVYAEQCITWALGSVATLALDASAIDAFCPVVPEQYQYLCPIARDAMVTQIEQTTQGFITEPGFVRSPVAGPA